MRQRIVALFVSVFLAASGLGVAVSIAGSGSTAHAAVTAPAKCKKCKKIVKKAKKCKKSHNNSAKCKKTIKKAKKCKKVLRSKKCKKQPSASPSTEPTGGSGGGTKQEEKGGIAQPNPFPQDPNSCYSGKYRREAVLTNGANKGTDGYHFDIDPSTIGKNFLLTVDGGEQDPDLDITFYTTLGTQAEAADPQNAPPNQSFETRAAGGEHGVVPSGMKVAIVCMLTGVNSTFTYTAGAGVATPK
jgi:hypothetical protein